VHRPLADGITPFVVTDDYLPGDTEEIVFSVVIDHVPAAAIDDQKAIVGGIGDVGQILLGRLFLQKAFSLGGGGEGQQGDGEGGEGANVHGHLQSLCGWCFSGVNGYSTTSAS
jgi:hypothetical protein